MIKVVLECDTCGYRMIEPLARGLKPDRQREILRRATGWERIPQPTGPDKLRCRLCYERGTQSNDQSPATMRRVR